MAKKRLNRLKEVLKERELSQYRLAKDTGISYKTINGYVNGKVEPSLESLKTISDKLNVPGKDLINF